MGGVTGVGVTAGVVFGAAETAPTTVPPLLAQT